MPAGHGLRSRTRDLFARPFKKKGPTHLSTYLRVYKVADYVDVKVNGSIHKGMPHKFYHGRTGRVWNVTKCAIGVVINKQMANKEAIEKERARIKDEMSRGYFADMKEMKEHGGKVSEANKIIIPAMAAIKFPTLEVTKLDGSALKLPITSLGNEATATTSNVSKVCLMCLSFRENSQAMVDSWSLPFLQTFGHSSNIQLYQVSFIDSWLLTRSPIRKLLLKVILKSKLGEKQEALPRQIVYSFGDHYYFRKELRILNLLTGYVFMLDNLGRIRWQGSGLATENEVSSLLSCTTMLLEEK